MVVVHSWTQGARVDWSGVCVGQVEKALAFYTDDNFSSPFSLPACLPPCLALSYATTAHPYVSSPYFTLFGQNANNVGGSSSRTTFSNLPRAPHTYMS